MNLHDLGDAPDDARRLTAERIAAGTRSTWVSVLVNIVLTITQVTVGLLSKSQALVADGIHSLSDLVADFVVLFAGHHARKDADKDHPYGHARFETAASLVLGVLLVAVGLGMLWSAIRKLESPETVAQVHASALWVAVGALVAKELLFRYMLAVAKRVKSSMLVANAWHARSDAASSLVVGLGIVGNLAGYPILDPIAALIVGCMVSKMGWGFGWDALHDLMDRSADAQEVAAIRQTLVGTPGVRSVHDVRIRKMRRHGRGRCPHRGRCQPQRRGRPRDRGVGPSARAAAPPCAQRHDARRSLASARFGPRASAAARAGRGRCAQVSAHPCRVDP